MPGLVMAVRTPGVWAHEWPWFIFSMARERRFVQEFLPPGVSCAVGNRVAGREPGEREARLPGGAAQGAPGSALPDYPRWFDGDASPPLHAGASRL